MTNIYFVRHALPLYSWHDAATRPLTEEGWRDVREVVKLFKDIPLDYAVTSPYVRSINTIQDTARAKGLEIHTDSRLRERKNGKNSNHLAMFRKRWADFSFCEPDGESLGSVQKRNIEAVFELLDEHKNENIIVGTHGTALSTILHYFDPTFGLEGFLRIIDFMPYVIRLGFEDHSCIEREELLIVEKEFNPK